MSSNDTIYQIYAAKYHELGFNPIPVFGKRPFLVGWSQFCTKRMTEDELHELENLETWGGARDGAQIGLAMGYGVVALDIDTDDIRVHQLVPHSPIRKKGQTGFTSLYRVGGHIPSHRHQLFPVELLAVGAQTVVPPSIHPDSGCRYEWLGDTVLENINDLPEIDVVAVYEKLVLFCRDNNITRSVKNSMDGASDRADNPSEWSQHSGRNNYLTNWCYARVCQMGFERWSVDDVARDLLGVDKKVYGDRAWFCDPKEHSNGKSPEERAKTFVTRAIESAKKKGQFFNGEIRVELEDLPQYDDSVEKENNEPHSSVARKLSDAETQKLIDSVYFLKMWAEYVKQNSMRYSPSLTLGSGIALLSVMAANLFSINQTRSNLYILNVAPTGEGKDAPQVCAKNLLSALKLHNKDYAVPTFERYKSMQSIILDVTRHPRRLRLDVQDEVGIMMQELNKQGSPLYGSGPVLCGLFSASKSGLGEQRAMDEKKSIEAVKNPSVTMLGSTTMKGVQMALSGMAAESGLSARLLLFKQERRGSLEEPDSLSEYVEIPVGLRNMFFKYMKVNPVFADADININGTFNDREILCRVPPMEESFTARIKSIQKEVQSYSVERCVEESLLATMLTRRREMLYKLALCWYVGQDSREPVGHVAAEWANLIISNSTAAVMSIVDETLQTSEARVCSLVARLIGDKPRRVDKVNLLLEKQYKYILNRDPSSNELKNAAIRLYQSFLKEASKDALGKKYFTAL